MLPKIRLSLTKLYSTVLTFLSNSIRRKNNIKNGDNK